MSKYIGFDVDSKKTVACVVQEGKKDRYTTFETDIEQMQNFLKQQSKDTERLHLTFEVSGQSGYIHDSLLNSVDTIAVGNPAKMTWIYRTAKKTDRIDARKQAVLLSIGEIPKVHMPKKRVRQWRAAIQHRRKIVSSITQVKNRIRALLKSVGINKPVVTKNWWTKANHNWMRQLSDQPTETIQSAWQLTLADMLDQLELFQLQLKQRTKYLDQYLQTQSAAKLIMTIPGVGPRTAEAVLAYTDDIKRFSKNKRYCAYFGLTPRLDESGTTRRLGHISKQGPSVVRWLIVEAAWQVVKKSPSLKIFFERVMAGQKNRKKIAIIAVARKLLTIIRAMLITGELFNEQLISKYCYQQ